MQGLLLSAAYAQYKVEFPKLGWSFNVTKEAFSIGGFDVYWYAVIIAAAFLLGIVLGLMSCKKYGISQNDLLDILIFTAPLSMVCARIYYVVFSWDKYQGDIGKILNLREGGLAIYGGLIGAFATVFVVTRIKKMSFMRCMDFAAPYIALGQAIGRWGNFVNQEAFGVNTDLPWGMTSPIIKETLMYKTDSLANMGITVDPTLPVHPAFLYESLFNLLFFVILLWFRNKNKDKMNGANFFLYLAMYGCARFFIEGLRIDSLYIGDTTIRVSQVLAAVCAVICAAVFVVMLCKAKKEKVPVNTEEASTNTEEASVKSEEVSVNTEEVAADSEKAMTNSEETQAGGDDNKE